MKNYIILLLLISFLTTSYASTANDLIINEIVSSNVNGIKDSYNDHSDWIELYNPTSKDLNLSNYYLSDNNENKTKWQLPDIRLSSNHYLLIFASEKETFGNEYHANFKLSAEGETLSLYSSSGTLINQLAAVKMKDDVSYGCSKLDHSTLVYFAEPTPNTQNSDAMYEGLLDSPELSQTAGFYTDHVAVDADHYEDNINIRYTTDGSTPTINSPVYDATLEFENASVHPNYYSKIPTNPSFDYKEDGYDSKRADNRGWLEPYNNVAKINVLNVKAFKDNYIPSDIKSSSYLILDKGIKEYNLPIISLTTDEANFFNDESGIYVYGTTGEEGNYKESGREWERLTHIQYFDKKGNLDFEQNLGARIHGGGGRHSAIKNLRMYARSEYGEDEIDYDFFDDSKNDKFKRLLIRGPGHRPDCAPRDDLADLLLQNQDMDIQHVHHVILFINGEYWGIHTVKERFDLDYLALKYGKDDDDYVIMKNGRSLDSGEAGDDQPYLDLLSFVDTMDMSDDGNYEYVKTKMDMDNYLTYLTSEIYMGNVDWIINNIKYWRYKGEDGNPETLNPLDGRWRWFLFDFDLVFGSSCASISPNINVLDDTFDPETGTPTILARGLRNNAQFRNALINRMCDLMNSCFNTKNFMKCIAEIDSVMTPQMLEYTQRWRYPSVSETLVEREQETPSLDRWNMTFKELYVYPPERKRKIIDHLKEEFALEDTLNLSVNINDSKMGTVKVNSLLISEQLDGVNSNLFPWNGAYFKNTELMLTATPTAGYRFVKWKEIGNWEDNLIISFDKDTEMTAIFEIDPDFKYDKLYINELMASNKNTIDNDFGESADWIEIYNPNNYAVDLANHYISDDATLPNKYKITEASKETTIEALGHKLIWCDNNDERGPLYTNFKLSSAGETVVLSAPNLEELDRTLYTELEQDYSWGRKRDGENEWMIFKDKLSPTPLSANGTGTNSDDKNLYIYPNPVLKGEVPEVNTNVAYKLYNSMGQLLQDLQSNEDINTSKLVYGIYIIQTEDGKSGKLIVK